MAQAKRKSPSLKVTKKESDTSKLKVNYIRYQNIIKYMRDCVAIYKPTADQKDFIFIDFNPSAEKTEHIKRNKVIGKRLTKVFPNVDKFGLLKILKKVLKTGKPYHLPPTLYQDKRVSGWRENYVYKLPTGEIVAIYRDVTKEVVQQQKIQESEEKLAFLIESFVDPIFIHDLDGNIVQVNKAACKSLGHSRKSLLNKNVVDIDLAFPSKKLKPLLKKQKIGVSFFVRGLHRKKNGKTFPVRVHSILLQFKNEQLFVSTVQDLSDELDAIAKINEQARKLENQVNELKGANQTIKNISDNLPIFMYYFAPIEQCIHSFSDKQWKKWTGQSLKNICINHLNLILDSIHPDDRSQTLKHYQKSFKNKKIFKCSYRILNKLNNKISYVDHYIVPMKNKKGTLTKVDGIIVDVTDLTLSQQNILHRLEYEETVQKITTNFANLSVNQTTDAIKTALKLLANFIAVDYADVFLFNPEKQNLEIAASWHNKSCPSISNNIKNKTYKNFPDLMELIQKAEFVYIMDAKNIPQTFSVEKKYWVQLKFKSVLYIPLVQNAICFGFIQFATKNTIRKFSFDEINMLLTTNNVISSAISRQIASLNEADYEAQLKQALLGTIQAISLTVERRDPYTAGHQQRVAQLAVAIAKKLNLSDDEIEGIRLGALIHDIGKIHIPNEILSRPGIISDAEMDLIRTHPQVGYDIVKHIQFPWPIASMVLNHHERLDGSGYPNHLKAKDITLAVRILSVSDVVEAMCSHRPYRPAKNLSEAFDEIRKHQGTLYDRKVVQACLEVFQSDHFKFEERDIDKF